MIEEEQRKSLKCDITIVLLYSIVVSENKRFMTIILLYFLDWEKSWNMKELSTTELV